MTADVRAHLVRALVQDAGAGARVADIASSPWASATFVGERHRLSMTLPSPGADRMERDLPERDFAIFGHLVADIAIVGRADREGHARLTIEALTIEEW